MSQAPAADPVLVISSDWHIETHAWKKRRDIRNDAIFSLEQIIQCQLQLNVPHLALGDLLEDPQPTPEEVNQIVKLISDTKNRDLPIYFVQGQHEMVRECPDVPWLSISDWPIHIHKQLIEIGGLQIYGLDYTPIGRCQEEFNQIPDKADVLATHQVWRDWIPNGSANASFKEVPYVSAVFTGDFHKHFTCTTVGRDGQQMQVLSPGSICLKKIDEPADKYFFVLYEDGQLRSVPLLARHVYRFKLMTEQDMMFMLDEAIPSISIDSALPADLQKPILDIEYSLAIPHAYMRLINRIGNKCHVFSRPIMVMQQPKEIDSEERQQKVIHGLEGCLETLVHKDSDVYNVVKRLLQATDPKEELQTMYQEVLNGRSPYRPVSSPINSSDNVPFHGATRAS